MAYTNNKSITGDVSIGARYFANYGSKGIASPAVHASQIDELGEGIALEIEKANSRANAAVKSIVTSNATKVVASTGITIGTDSSISVNYDTNTLGTAAASDSSGTQKLRVRLDSNGGLKAGSDGIRLNLGSGLEVVSNSSGSNLLTISAGDGLSYSDSDGTISVTNAGTAGNGVLLGTFKKSSSGSMFGVPFNASYFSEDGETGIGLNFTAIGNNLGVISTATINALA